MPLQLDTSITVLGKVGAQTAAKLKRLEIGTVRDLIFYYPSSHDDLREVTPIHALGPSAKVTVRGVVQLIANRRSPLKKRLLTEAVVADRTGTIKVLWFNQPYLPKFLPVGTEVYLSGTVDVDRRVPQLISPVYEKAYDQKDPTHTARIVPMYSLTAGITQKQLRYLIAQALEKLESLDDPLAPAMLKTYALMGLDEAVRQIHFPVAWPELEQAVRRLKFDELLLHEQQVLEARRAQASLHAVPVAFAEPESKRFTSTLPFQLTDDQRRAAWEIVQDIGKDRPMHRLLEGEVGSGKTVVAALAALNVGLGGGQSVVMAPTEILAQQHFETFSELLRPCGLHVALFTRTKQAIDGREVKRSVLLAKVKAGDVQMLVGTHALLSESLHWRDLRFAIIDEQHRFGVEQRQALARQGGHGGRVPHVLLMTATPIPRTLAQVLYADLDISLIRQLPKERKPIHTEIIEPKDRVRAYEFIRDEVRSGRRVFVVCPLVDPSDRLGVKSATEEYERLQTEVFPDIPVGLLHGKLKTVQKDEVMRQLQVGSISILVSTSVVEVGVNVPEASVILIEGAERFGLAQLHQFRGRVGRSTHQAYCFLFTDHATPSVRQRLAAFVASRNGFELAEKDLQFRGPGQLYGVRQFGWPQFRLAQLSDVEIMRDAKKAAEEIENNKITK